MSMEGPDVGSTWVMTSSAAPTTAVAEWHVTSKFRNMKGQDPSGQPHGSATATAPPPVPRICARCCCVYVSRRHLPECGRAQSIAALLDARGTVDPRDHTLHAIGFRPCQHIGDEDRVVTSPELPLPVVGPLAGADGPLPGPGPGSTRGPE